MASSIARATAWPAAPDPLPLPGPIEVHVWRAVLDDTVIARARDSDALSAAERVRASSYARPPDGERFLARRLALRQTLGRYPGFPAAALQLTEAASGKPTVAGNRLVDLRFNQSGSGDLVLIVVAVGREVGIDVERLDPGVPVEEMARRFFTPREAGEISERRADRRRSAFFLRWAIREAAAKAVGVGMSAPPAAFEVDSRCRTVVVRGALFSTGAVPAQLSVRELPVGPLFRAAVAAEGMLSSVRRFSLWPGSPTVAPPNL
jgi:4'-phosphopantetheinyl transferase